MLSVNNVTRRSIRELALGTAPAFMIRAVLLDLGNVLLHFDHHLLREQIAALRPGGDDRETADLVQRFERGLLDGDTFIDTMLDRAAPGARPDREAFITQWCDIFWKNEELTALLPELAKAARLVMVSNTNALHVDFAQRRFPEVFAPFHARIYSHEQHARKPEPAMFRAAAEAAGVPPEQCLFFDDISEYVEAAACIGMHAYQYVSVSGVRDILAAYGLPAGGTGSSQ
jgi:glucose-1-phosphatase